MFKSCFAIFSMRGRITGLVNRLQLSNTGIQNLQNLIPTNLISCLTPLNCSMFLKHSGFILLLALSSFHTLVHVVPSTRMPNFSTLFLQQISVSFRSKLNYTMSEKYVLTCKCASFIVQTPYWSAHLLHR